MAGIRGGGCRRASARGGGRHPLGSQVGQVAESRRVSLLPGLEPGGGPRSGARSPRLGEAVQRPGSAAGAEIAVEISARARELSADPLRALEADLVRQLDALADVRSARAGIADLLPRLRGLASYLRALPEALSPSEAGREAGREALRVDVEERITAIDRQLGAVRRGGRRLFDGSPLGSDRASARVELNVRTLGLAGGLDPFAPDTGSRVETALDRALDAATRLADVAERLEGAARRARTRLDHAVEQREARLGRSAEFAPAQAPAQHAATRALRAAGSAVQPDRRR